VLLLPARALDDLADAFGEADRADPQPVRGQRIRFRDDAEAQLRGIHAELLGDLVELDLLAEARLRRAVPAFRAARRLVRERAARFEAVARDLVRHGLQHARVERARDAVRAVAAAVDERLQADAGQLAVFVTPVRNFISTGCRPRCM
jgi:hypothetical protein